MIVVNNNVVVVHDTSTIVVNGIDLPLFNYPFINEYNTKRFWTLAVLLEVSKPPCYLRDYHHNLLLSSGYVASSTSTKYLL